MRTAPAGRSRDVNAVRGLLVPGMVVVITALIGVWLAAESRAQAPSPAGSIAGGWTLNKELSDKPQAARDQDNGGRRRGGGGGGRGGHGRGGGGGGRGGAGPGAGGGGGKAPGPPPCARPPARPHGC